MSDQFRTRLINIRPIGIGHNEPLDAVEETGVFYFRHDVLDQLPSYMMHVKKMASADPDAYALYSKLGGTLLPPSAMLATTLRDFDIGNLPTFSCIMFPDHNDAPDRISPRLLYLKKTKAFGTEHRDGEQSFAMTMLYTKLGEPISFPLKYHVSVADDGTVRLLRELQSKNRYMISKRGPYENRRYNIPTREWGIPGALRELAAENQRDVHQMAATCFCLLASVAPRMRIGFQVRVSKNNGPRAVFNIAAKRTPYFFKDRELTVNENGRKKRIFHYVNGFQRADGIITKPHVRGLREFSWNGFHVNVGIPDMTIPDVRKFRASGLDVDRDENVPGYIEESEAAEIMMQRLETA
jgi:hypothetical protein